ncbi:nuclear transport factor 2 family protein [Nonomuraea sediminis]|uniref:nuclear transport factor 2 family protein n=1 Tax=Nonomuraea sediminis TaxID=2835864 RepID=UPI001BDD2C4D|nr:nuclear transport factor 2 family protein [Nonomuraea sediminis]
MKLVEQYLEIWNERDAARREAAIEEVMTEDSVYSDPDYAGIEGHAALSEAIGKAHEKFGDLRFRLGEVIGAHHDTALFTWHLGDVATGYDMVEFAGDRIRRVVGYF